MPSTERHDPYAGFNFRVEIDGVVAGAFSECCGLSSETEVVSYREGGDFRVRRLPGLTKYANLVLKHGITLDRSLWNWRQTVVTAPSSAATAASSCWTPPARKWRAGTSATRGRPSG